MRIISNRYRLPLLVFCAATAVAGCKDKNRTAYALTSTNTIIKFETNTPQTIESEATVSGLTSTESLLQIDYRPASSTMYGITYDTSSSPGMGSVVTVNPDTGVVTRIASGTYYNTNAAGSLFTLNAPVVMDVNPVGDYLRVIDYSGSTTGASNNFRVSPTTGAFQQSDQLAANPALYYNDTDTNSGNVPELAAIAHNDDVVNASATTLYGLDETTQSLVTIATGGQLKTVANCGHAFVHGNAGFDIVPDSDQAFAALGGVNENAVLYNVDLGTCNLNYVNEIGGGRRILSLAVTLVDNTDSSN